MKIMLSLGSVAITTVASMLLLCSQANGSNGNRPLRINEPVQITIEQVMYRIANGNQNIGMKMRENPVLFSGHAGMESAPCHDGFNCMARSCKHPAN